MVEQYWNSIDTCQTCHPIMPHVHTQEMFDYDDELMYEPKQTAAIIMTGGNEEEETAAREVCVLLIGVFSAGVFLRCMCARCAARQPARGILLQPGILSP